MRPTREGPRRPDAVPISPVGNLQAISGVGLRHMRMRGTSKAVTVKLAVLRSVRSRFASEPPGLLRDGSQSELTMASLGLDTQQSGDECVDILVSVIERQRRPDGRLQSEAAQNGLRSGALRNAMPS